MLITFVFEKMKGNRKKKQSSVPSIISLCVILSNSAFFNGEHSQMSNWECYLHWSKEHFGLMWVQNVTNNNFFTRIDCERL